MTTTGSSDTGIGFRADVSAGDLTTATAIGENAVVDASDKIRLGDGRLEGTGSQRSNSVTMTWKRAWPQRRQYWSGSCRRGNAYPGNFHKVVAVLPNTHSWSSSVLKGTRSLVHQRELR